MLIAMLARAARYMPDHMKDRWMAGAATGVGVVGLGASSLLSALGFSAVAHSSGAAILTGAGGYIAGTYGVAAIVGWIMWIPMMVVFGVCAVVGLFVLVSRRLRIGK
ncbi:MAG: hypothetical protein MUE98_04395 [Rhodobacteraceae bacterium]|jgi:hypothetical protein|nr:hypothetical protein [Paracoccaceae bacterium]